MSPKFSYVTQVMEMFSLDLLATTSYWTELHLESCQTPNDLKTSTASAWNL